MENPVELEAEEHSGGLKSPGHEKAASTGDPIDQGSRSAEDAAGAERASGSESTSSYADPVK